MTADVHAEPTSSGTSLPMPRFSFYVIPFKNEPLATSAERLARFGYDALEVPGEPEQYPVRETRAMLEANGLAASAVCGRVYGPERDLSCSNAAHRRTAIDYFRTLVEMADGLGAPAVLLGPLTAVRRNMPESSAAQEWAWAVEGLRAIAQSANGSQVRLVVEPWNRYETHLVNRIEQALHLVRDAGIANAGVMGDLFHMNIEEADLAAALAAAGPRLVNIHFADSNRRAPGRGHIDFVPVMRALQAIGYRDYLSVEYLPPRFVFEFGVPDEFFDAYTGETIATLRRAWTAAKEQGR